MILNPDSVGLSPGEGERRHDLVHKLKRTMVLNKEALDSWNMSSILFRMTRSLSTSMNLVSETRSNSLVSKCQKRDGWVRDIYSYIRMGHFLTSDAGAL